MATLSDVSAAAQKLSFTIPRNHEADYLALLRTTDKAVAAVMAYPGNTRKVHRGETKLIPRDETTKSQSTRPNTRERISIGRCPKITN
jgi:hypothetical protein